MLILVGLGVKPEQCRYCRTEMLTWSTTYNGQRRLYPIQEHPRQLPGVWIDTARLHWCDEFKVARAKMIAKIDR